MAVKYETYAKLRDSKGVTDYKVSQDTGIATGTLTDWKMGRYTPKLEKMQLLAKYFGVTLEELIDG